MKATMAQLKKSVNAKVTNTGLKLSKNAPYWVNAEQIKYIEAAVADTIQAGIDNPTKRWTASEKQVEALNNWVKDLKHKYL